MPKQKTRSTAKKRFSVKPSGVVKRNRQNRRHILTKKSQLAKWLYVNQLMLAKPTRKTLKVC